MPLSRPIILNIDETIDTENMTTLWKLKQLEDIKLHSFRERMIRKELPESDKIYRRLQDPKNGTYWRDVHRKAIAKGRYSSAQCPLGCGSIETDNHFRIC
jgi:hypothetical protein